MYRSNGGVPIFVEVPHIAQGTGLRVNGIDEEGGRGFVSVAGELITNISVLSTGRLKCSPPASTTASINSAPFPH